MGKLLFHSILGIMKDTLNLEEFSYREAGRSDPRYRTFKKHLMEFTYSNLRELLSELQEWGLLESTEDGEDVKNGYKNNSSGGSGYENSQELNNFLEEQQSTTSP